MGKSYHLWSAGPLADPARAAATLVRAGRHAASKSALEAAEPPIALAEAQEYALPGRPGRRRPARRVRPARRRPVARLRRRPRRPVPREILGRRRLPHARTPRRTRPLRPQPAMPYPAACRPQAWSAAATVLILQTTLGLQPDTRTRGHPHQPAKWRGRTSTSSARSLGDRCHPRRPGSRTPSSTPSGGASGPIDHLGKGAVTWVRPRMVRWLRMAAISSGPTGGPGRSAFPRLRGRRGTAACH